MSKVVLYLLVVLCLAEACDRRAIPNPSTSEWSTLDSLTDNFFNEASSRGINLGARKAVVVRFGTLPQDKAGSCRPNEEPKVITIDYYFWKIAHTAAREQLLFHELAHCLLQRTHLSDTFKFGECKSWMRASDAACLVNLSNKKWRSYYLDELFSKRQNDGPLWYNDYKISDISQLDRHTVSLVPMGAQLKYLLGKKSKDWVLRVAKPAKESSQKAGVFGIRINELVVDYNNYNIDHQYFLTATIITNSSSHTLLSVKHRQEEVILTIEKRGHCAYVFINDALKYCLPLDDTITITQFGSPESVYPVNIYYLP